MLHTTLWFSEDEVIKIEIVKGDNPDPDKWFLELTGSYYTIFTPGRGTTSVMVAKQLAWALLARAEELELMIKEQQGENLGR
jgi:hypothetical protein